MLYLIRVPAQYPKQHRVFAALESRVTIPPRPGFARGQLTPRPGAGRAAEAPRANGVRAALGTAPGPNTTEGRPVQHPATLECDCVSNGGGGGLRGRLGSAARERAFGPRSVWHLNCQSRTGPLVPCPGGRSVSSTRARRLHRTAPGRDGAAGMRALRGQVKGRCTWPARVRNGQCCQCSALCRA